MTDYAQMVINDKRQIAHRQMMLTLQNFKQIVSTIRKEPTQYRIECLNVSINTNMGLYEQELNGEGISIYIFLKKLIEKCSMWEDVENLLKAFEDFYNHFLVSKCVDLARIEVLLKLGVYRGYITLGELNGLGNGADLSALQSILIRLGVELLETPPQNDLILFSSKNE